MRATRQGSDGPDRADFDSIDSWSKDNTMSQTAAISNAANSVMSQLKSIDAKNLIFDVLPISLGPTTFQRKTKLLIAWGLHFLIFLVAAIVTIGTIWILHLLDQKLSNYVIRGGSFFVLVWAAFVGAHASAIFVEPIIWRTFLMHMIVYLVLITLLLNWFIVDMFDSGIPYTAIFGVIFSALFFIHASAVVIISMRKSKRPPSAPRARATKQTDAETLGDLDSEGGRFFKSAV
ncbi:hypothetical protein J8273_2493 [Carpediemonas membranifera]|uniref:Uncharacterized protein n=1 Tax=Carpediemonas membranifera TaxID=201153 RepID=A0A8J6C026_9EUKA|nr:hypothetical protein J8273_2493 [Carpediemonas membranifera]|eukprot:KAG9396141.1 hypothetical protein J8273_2493 [Carpediemonas membranifera]